MIVLVVAVSVIVILIVIVIVTLNVIVIALKGRLIGQLSVHSSYYTHVDLFFQEISFLRNLSFLDLYSHFDDGSFISFEFFPNLVIAI